MENFYDNTELLQLEAHTGLDFIPDYSHVLPHDILLELQFPHLKKGMKRVWCQTVDEDIKWDNW